MMTINLSRSTKETTIDLSLNLHGKGDYEIKTGIGFLDHMLIAFAVHGGFDLTLSCQGDLEVDNHHTVEDIGIVLGKAFAQGIDQYKGKINRYGSFLLPMDEALTMVSLDLCGRSYLHYELPPLPPMIGDLDTQTIEEFLRAFVQQGGITLHIVGFHGKNGHHIVESLFKGLARALRQAVSLTNDGDINRISTKGLLESNA